MKRKDPALGQIELGRFDRVKVWLEWIQHRATQCEATDSKKRRTMGQQCQQLPRECALLSTDLDLLARTKERAKDHLFKEEFPTELW